MKFEISIYRFDKIEIFNVSRYCFFVAFEWCDFLPVTQFSFDTLITSVLLRLCRINQSWVGVGILGRYRYRYFFPTFTVYYTISKCKCKCRRHDALPSATGRFQLQQLEPGTAATCDESRQLTAAVQTRDKGSPLPPVVSGPINQLLTF